jgi:hypothetical protein
VIGRVVAALLVLPLLAACGGEDREAAPRSGQEAVADAIAAGLGWFERVQEEDGSFSLHKWNPHHGKPDLEGFSQEDKWFDPAATGLVVLAYAAAGHASLKGPEDSCARRALRWLLAQQRESGRFGYDEERVDKWFVTKMRKHSLYSPAGAGYKALTIHMFNHAVPAAAVAEAYRVTRDKDLREPLRRALRHLEHDEHPEFVWTSYYDPYSDVAVVPYVLIAATAARAMGLARDSEPLLEPALDFLDRVTDEETGRTVMWAAIPQCFDGHDSTAINAFCRRLLGQHPESEPLSLSLASFAKAPLAWKAAGDLSEHDRALGTVVNHELWFHGARAFEGVPAGESWLFPEKVRKLYLENQVRAGEHAGSWDPIGVWDRVGGRIYATAMAIRTLAADRSVSPR